MKTTKKKKTNMRTVIRQIVREEVAMAIKEVVTELKQPTQQISENNDISYQKYTKNSVLNDVLNETAMEGDWKQMGGSKFTSERMNELVGGQYSDMMDDTPTPRQVPSSDPMSQFLNKDYSEVLKKSEEKSKQKHGR